MQIKCGGFYVSVYRLSLFGLRQGPDRLRDDIVVCPDCGAPYHRACYEKQGGCVYADKHGTGFEWTPPASAQP